jgi:hypothetical protein
MFSIFMFMNFPVFTEKDAIIGFVQVQPDQSQWNGGGYYGYPQGYDAYGYAAAAPQDPNMYYGGYPGYGNYQQPGAYQQQQQVK